MTFLRNGFAPILMLFLAVGCGSDGGSGTGQSQGIAGQALNKAQQSISAAGAQVAASKIVQSLSVSMGLASFDPHCTGMGTDAGSSADYIGCILQNNDGSPETIQGSLNLINEIISGIESQMTLTYPTTAQTSDEMTISVTTADGTLTPSIVIREAAGDGSPWTQLLDICIMSIPEASYTNTLQNCLDNGFTFTIQLRTSTTQLGFRTINRISGSGSYESAAFLIDSSTDELRFESWSFANGFHTRGYVTGNVSTDLVLDSVTGVRFASAFVDGANWGGIHGSYDGTNICMNYETSTAVDNQLQVGTCGSYPEYEDGFHDFSGAAAFQIWANNDAKGLLNFDTTFHEDLMFVDN